MKAYLHPGFIDKFTEYNRILIITRNINNQDENANLLQKLRDVEKEVQNNTELQNNISEHPQIANWREAFRRFGSKPSDFRPSVEALVRRVVNKHETAYINTIVAIANYICLKYLVPCGGDDLALIEGDFGLKLAEGNEPFEAIGADGSKRPDAGEVILSDEKKVMCRKWVWRQGNKTKVGENTKFAVFNIDILPPVSLEDGKKAAAEFVSLVKEFCNGEAEYFVLNSENHSYNVEAIPSDVKVKASSEIKQIKSQHQDVISNSADMADWTIDDLLLRGSVEDIIVKDTLLDMLRRDEKIKIYQGFDPTSPNLHIGHLVSLRVLRWFQLHGHHVIFLIGDGTGLVGDPSGRSAQRNMLTPEIVAKNMVTYKEQARKILDFDTKNNPVEVLKNSVWLLSLTLQDILPLMTKITAQRLLERDMFQDRIRKGEPLYYVETIYPLLQGYDSVAMDVDAELGGRDQLFNMLVGRDLVRDYLGKEKHVLTTPLLPGFDGRKMSKTYGNTVDLTASPFKMYDGIMQVHDDLILTYFRLLTNVSWDELERFEQQVKKDPLATKEQLAFEITKLLTDEKSAQKAHQEFVNVRRQGKIPDEIIEVTINKTNFSGEEIIVTDLLAQSNPAILSSKSEARRKIAQGGVYFEENRIDSIEKTYLIDELDGKVIRTGKKKFYKVKIA